MRGSVALVDTETGVGEELGGEFGGIAQVGRADVVFGEAGGEGGGADSA